MAGRNDQAIANAMTAVAQALNNALQGQQNQQGAADELRLDRFMRNNPPTFKGRYDPDGAQNWLEGIERIFRAMASTNEQKVRLATHMLAEEAEFWWGNARQRLEGAGTVVTWEVFREEFLGKYFPADVRNKKEIEFLELKQGNVSVSEYAAKFEELSRFCPYINAADAEVSKCLKFENGLRLEIKQFIGYQQIRQFSSLVTACRIYEDDSKKRASHYKAVSEKKGRDQSRGKPYSLHTDKEKQEKGTGEKEASGEDVRPPPRCYNCGDTGHRVSECKKGVKCFNCNELVTSAHTAKSRRRRSMGERCLP
jgi:hypothetical protein